MKPIPYLQRPALVALMSACLSSTAILQAQEVPGQNDRPAGDIENSDPFRKGPQSKLTDDLSALLEEQARILFARGEGEKALATQIEAIEKLKTAKAQLSETLAKYEGRPTDSPISRKLREIIIPKVDFEDVSIREAVEFLRLRAIELDTAETDPTKKGVNIVVGQSPAATGAPTAEGNPPPNPIRELRLRNVPLGEVLKYICSAAQLRCEIDSHAVSLLPATSPGAPPNPASNEWAQAVRDLGNDARLLNAIAWSMVCSESKFPEYKKEKAAAADPFAEPVKRGPVPFALSAAQRANQLTNGKDPDILNTLARVHFSRGEIDKAIELQTKAVDMAPADMKEGFLKTVLEYKKEKKNSTAADPLAEPVPDSSGN